MAMQNITTLGLDRNPDNPSELIINDLNYDKFLDPLYNVHLNTIDGNNMRARGLRPRNYAATPLGHYPTAKPFDIPLIPQDQWQSLLDQQIAAKAQLSNVRLTGNAGQPIPSRDQNGKGYCWAHSSTSANLVVRAINNQPYADLSAYAVACIIKGYRDEGGWGAESLQFIAERGIPTSQYWPQQSMSRSNDKPETWANAGLHKFTDWIDLDPRNQAQLVTCLLMGYPVVSDFNWWSHSVCSIDLVSVNPFRTRIWNSWGDSWSDKGMGILEAQKAIPDSM